jgi:hypothetical protein
MKKLTTTAIAVIATLVLAGAALAALQPGVYDPANTGCPKASFTKGTLHLEKNCPTPTEAAAGADITGLTGQTFQSAQFTLASATQCQGGSPRFIIGTSTGMYPLGCNNVTPVTNANGTVTYVFTAATLAAAGQQVATPTGTIDFVSVLIDVQGTADLTNIVVNGKKQKPESASKGLMAACKNGGWKTFTNPKFKNQGQCIKYVVHTRNAAKKTHKTHKPVKTHS